MGINFKEYGGHYSNAQWSYSGFGNFRRKVALEFGIDLFLMEGFCGNRLMTPISWNTVKHPIKYFLNHSDSDGSISAKRCEVLYPIIKDVISKWDKNTHDYISGRDLIKTMKICAKNNKRLIFC